MGKARERWFSRMPRRNQARSQLAAWCLHVEIPVNSETNILKDIYLRAPHGEVAKTKALPRLRHFAERMNILFDANGKLKLTNVTLKKISPGRDTTSPIYVLREKCQYYGTIISTHQPSKAFKTANGNGHNGGSNGR